MDALMKLEICMTDAKIDGNLQSEKRSSRIAVFMLVSVVYFLLQSVFFYFSIRIAFKTIL